MRLETKALEYQLPPDLLALTPCHRRDHARLMVASKSTGDVEHVTVAELPHYLRQDDLLVINQTMVVAARFQGQRVDSGGHVEGLWLETSSDPMESTDETWRVMLKSNGKLRPGLTIAVTDHDGHQTDQRLVLDRPEKNTWIVRPEPPLSTEDFFDSMGLTPLPPYILSARRRDGHTPKEAEDRSSYQTIYADPDATGSIAAPTAGLHFTPEVMTAVEQKGCEIGHVNLKVGPGTFKPVECQFIDDHVVDAEAFSVPEQTLRQLARPRHARRIAVGTTTVRTLESLPVPLPTNAGPIEAETSLLITPGHRFRLVDALMTNFHLPGSSLLALVAAFAGLDQIQRWYAIAIAERYRFYSYGDAMLIVP